MFIFLGPFLFPNATITEMLIFGIVAISTNIMLGYTGMLSFGQALFFGTSAYISGLILLAAALWEFKPDGISESGWHLLIIFIATIITIRA